MPLPINLPQQFQFESHTLRVWINAVGKPWFNAEDVCAALELANPRDAIAKHADPEDVAKHNIINSLGRRQLANYVNESGLYALILSSGSDVTKRFKRWVAREMLPVIRNTGVNSATGTIATSLTPTSDLVSLILQISGDLSKVKGVNQIALATATLDCIQKHTGINVEGIRRALPAADDSTCRYSADQLGWLMGISPEKVNLRLASRGFQWRSYSNEWELTEAGKAWGKALPRHWYRDNEILWNPAVVEQLLGVTQ